MAEITINTLIKIVIVLAVIVVVTVSFFIIWRNYLQPYLSNMGKEVAGIVFLTLAKKKVLKIGKN